MKTSTRGAVPVLIVTLLLSACATRGQTRLLPIAVAPAEAYDCLLYELASAEFTITDADRSSGFVRALRVDRTLFDGATHREIHATVLAAPDGGGDVVQISSNADANAQADALGVACAR